MAYTPNEWESGDVVTASKLNALEQAVGELNMSYTPNNWSDGDVLSAAKMNALEQAVASGGGGGGGNFSTVTATLNATFPEDYYTFSVSCSLGQTGLIYSVIILDGEYCLTDYEFDVELTPSNLTLLKFGESGAFRIFADDVIVSGNATFDSETFTVTFTGDFTIAFSAIEP